MNFYSKINLQNNVDIIAYPLVGYGTSKISLQKMLPLSGGCDLREASKTNTDVYSGSTHTLLLDNIKHIGRYYWNSSNESGNKVYEFQGLSQIPKNTDGYTFELIVSAQQDDASDSLSPGSILQTLILRNYNAYTDGYYTGDEQIIYKRHYKEKTDKTWHGTWSGYFLPKLVNKESSTFVSLPKLTTVNAYCLSFSYTA
jgi:hypothetical protein